MILTEQNVRYTQRAASALHTLSESDRDQVLQVVRQTANQWPEPVPGLVAQTKRLRDGSAVRVLRAGPRLRVFVSGEDDRDLLVEDIAASEMLRQYFGWSE